ncbi:unnamed protein product [Rotaria socialis]|uniref:Uncharacterized protein n=1 Tax=Rotaria socialis TaxID=392032 RepID=A0A821E5X6_9BILA|nr:unnamed protein product [Rotaria socialis]CAF4630308.1 unnamed protein product [Rotaria socialis]
MMDDEPCPMYLMDCFIFPDTTILSSPIASYPCQPGRVGNFSNFNGSFAWCYGWIIGQQSSLNVLNQLGLCSGLIGLFAIIFAFTFHVGHRKVGLAVVLIIIVSILIAFIILAVLKLSLAFLTFATLFLCGLMCSFGLLLKHVVINQ